VLDPVEARGLAEQREEAVLERVAEELAEVPDGADVGVTREDLLYREGILGVDEERHLLGARPARELAFFHAGERFEVRLESRALARHSRVVQL
jgi:hypothetical protein